MPLLARCQAVNHGLHETYQGAEDVVQLAFEATLRAGWDTLQYPRAWLYTVTRRLVASQIKHAATRVEAHHGTRPGTATWSSMARLPSIEVQFAAEIATTELSALSTRRNQIAYRRLVLGWTHAEIAEELGITESTRRSTTSQALVSIRRLVNGVVSPSTTSTRRSPTTRRPWARSPRSQPIVSALRAR